MLNPQIAENVARRIQAGPNLNNMPPEWRSAIKARSKWLTIANEHQIPPRGDWWDIWLLLAGRGAGKTRTAAEDTSW